MAKHTIQQRLDRLEDNQIRIARALADLQTEVAPDLNTAVSYGRHGVRSIERDMLDVVTDIEWQRRNKWHRRLYRWLRYRRWACKDKVEEVLDHD